MLYYYGIFVQYVVFIKVWAIAQLEQSVNVGIVKENVRVWANHYYFSVRVRVFNGSYHRGGHNVFAYATLNMEYHMFVH